MLCSAQNDLFPQSRGVYLLQRCWTRDRVALAGGGWRHPGLPQPVQVISNQSEADRASTLCSESQAPCDVRRSGGLRGEELLSLHSLVSTESTGHYHLSVFSLECTVPLAQTHRSIWNIKHTFIFGVIKAHFEVWHFNFSSRCTHPQPHTPLFC